MHIGFIGGGNLARNLATLCLAVGHQVTLGVRDTSRGNPANFPLTDIATAAKADLVTLAVPFSACVDILPPLANALVGNTVVDATNPLNADWSPLRLGEENSAGETIARLLPGSHVVKAFNMVFADVMTAERLPRGEHCATVFVASDQEKAKETVIALANGIGFEGRDAGPLRNARYLEAMAHLNIHLAVALGGGTNAAFIYDRR
jgi:hypothetical protein